MDQPITPNELVSSSSVQKSPESGSSFPDPEALRNSALSPVLPQRKPKKGQKKAQKLLGSSSRGMGVLREAAATKNHITATHLDELDEDENGGKVNGTEQQEGEVGGSTSNAAASTAALRSSTPHLRAQASAGALRTPSKGATPEPQTPKTFITKPNGDTQELQTHASDTESVSSKQSVRKTPSGKKSKSKKSKSPKKSSKTPSAKKKQTGSSKQHVDVQTSFEPNNVSIQTKIDGDMMREMMMGGGDGGQHLSSIATPINTALRAAGSNASTPSGVPSPGGTITSNAFGSQQQSMRNFDKMPNAFGESVEDILEQLVDMYTEVSPDLKHKSEFRSMVMSVVSQIRMKENQATERTDNWKSRYEKLQEQWKRVMNDFDTLFKEKENLRKERDSLLCSQQDDFSKRALLQGVRLADSKLLKDFFVTDMQQAVSGIKESLNATFALLWVFNQDTNELQSIAVAPQPSDEDPETLQKVRREANFAIPCTKDLIGECFHKSEAINLLYAHKEEQHNHLVDILLNVHTKTMLCFPLISPRTQTAIGVIQVLNKTLLYTKKSMVRFTVDDEEKMNQYSYILGRLLDAARDLYSFGRGSRKQSVSNVPRRVGRPLSGGREERIEFLKFHGGLLPTHVKTYITELYTKQIEISTLYEQARSEVKRLSTENKTKDEAIQNLKFNQFIFVEDPKKKSKKDDLFKSINDLEQVVKSKKKDVSKIDVGALRQEVQKTTKAAAKAAENAGTTGKGSSLKRTSQSQFVLSSKTRKTIMALEKQLEELEESSEEEENVYFNAGEHVPNPLAQQSAPDDNEKVTRFITKKQKKLIEEQKRRRHRTVYRDIYVDMFSEHPIPLILLSKYFQVVHVNRSLCKALEVTQDFLIGKLFSTLATKVSHSNLAQFLKHDIINDVRIRKGMETYLIDEDDDRHTRIFQLMIRELGYVDTKFKLINNKVPLEGPLFLVCLIE